MRERKSEDARSAIIATMVANWHEASPEANFARRVFETIKEPFPVPGIGPGVWPEVQRLDQAPVLAAAGYLLSSLNRPRSREEQDQWLHGLERLSRRKAVRPDRVSFVYRPLEVLGIIVGATHCSGIDDRLTDWLRGLIRHLRDDQPLDNHWSDLLYATAASTLAERWHDRLYLRLRGGDVEALALLRWLIRSNAGSNLDAVDRQDALSAEVRRRVEEGEVRLRDVARAAVILQCWSGLSEGSDSKDAAGNGINSRRDETLRTVRLEIAPTTLDRLPAGSGVNVYLVEGDHHMGDHIDISGNVAASAIGAGATAIVRNATAFQNMVDNSAHFDAELKAKLKAARDAVETAGLGEGDKKDALDDLGKLTEELEKSQPEPGRVTRFLNRLKEIAPPAAAALASAATIVKIVASVHGVPTP